MREVNEVSAAERLGVRQAEWLEAIVATNRAIVGEGNSSTLAQQLVTAAGRVLGCEAGVLLANEGNRMAAVAAVGCRSPGPDGWVVGGKGVKRGLRRLFGAGRSDRVVAAPVRYRGTELGLFAMLRKGCGLSADEAEVLETLADQAAIVLSLRSREAGRGDDGGEALARVEGAFALAERERSKLEALMEVAPVGIVLWQLPGPQVVYANPLAQELFGGAVAEERLALVRRAFEPGEPVRQALASGGGRRALEVTAAPAHREGGRVVQVMETVREPGAGRDAEPTLEQMRARLARVSGELQKFAYVMAHDLKAPLRAVSNLSSWLEEDLDGKLDAATRRQLDLLRRRVERMDNFINALLEYSSAGEDGSASEPVAVRALVEKVLAVVPPPAGFTVELAPDLPLVEANRAHLHQVFACLIDNALQHHDRPSGSVWVAAVEAGAFYEFSVADDGPGVPERYRERIFELFQTLDRRDKTERLGIGLALAKKLVLEAGGWIGVEARTGGRGAVFRFRWPKQELR